MNRSSASEKLMFEDLESRKLLTAALPTPHISNRAAIIATLNAPPTLTTVVDLSGITRILQTTGNRPGAATPYGIKVIGTLLDVEKQKATGQQTENSVTIPPSGALKDFRTVILPSGIKTKMFKPI